MKDYTLYHMDIPIMKFKMDKMMISSDYIILNPEFLPMQLLMSEGRAFDRWLMDRALDISRSGARSLLKKLQLATSKIDIVVYANAMCMTDWFWINYSVSNFEQHIRFNNSDTEYQMIASLTSIGSFDKFWANNILYKSGSENNNRAEVLNMTLCHYLGLPSADYYIEGKYVCSPNFTSENLFLEHYESFRYAHIDIENPYELLSAYGLEKQYADILTVDAISSNPDRHYFNFGVLRDTRTGLVVSMAPNYDNNLGWGCVQKLGTAMLKLEWDHLSKDVLQKFSRLDLNNFPEEMRSVQEYVIKRLKL